MDGGTSLGTRIRRRRLSAGISQGELAQLAQTSQATISYYERNLVEAPSSDLLALLERQLNATPGEFVDAATQPSRQLAPSASAPVPPTSRYLETLRALPGETDWFPGDAETGGDLAAAVDLRSHAVLILVDAIGSGAAMANEARMLIACACGALMLPGGGAPSPEDIVDSVLRYWSTLHTRDGLPGICVVSFERRRRQARMCRLGVPAPYIVDRRQGRWTGKPLGPAGAYVGERDLGHGALLLIATDGVANLRVRTGRTLWDSPELRTQLSRAKGPEDVIGAISRRHGEAGGTRRDDMLAVAMKW